MVENQDDIAIPAETMTHFPSGSQEHISYPGSDFYSLGILIQKL